MKRALLVGVNAYTTVKPLRGCLEDVNEMKHLLGDVLHYDEIMVLKDQQVSKESVLNAIEDLFSPSNDAEDGARTLFFAGHGGRVFDAEDGDETIDSIDENLCMPNYNWDDSETYILDDELAEVLHAASKSCPGHRRYVVLDSCHSGTGTRWAEIEKSWSYVDQMVNKTFGHTGGSYDLGWPMEDPRVAMAAVERGAPEDPALEFRLASTEQATLSLSEIGEGRAGDPVDHLLLSGCSASQTCKDVPIMGKHHGIFTYTLTRFAANNPSATWQKTQKHVSGLVRDRFNQEPQLEGPEHLKLRPIFS